MPEPQDVVPPGYYEALMLGLSVDQQRTLRANIEARRQEEERRQMRYDQEFSDLQRESVSATSSSQETL